MDFKLLIKEPEKKARSLVRKITHSGETEQLDKQLLIELKSILKNIDDNNNNSIINNTFQECLKCLQKEHSQVRVTTVRLIDYLFKKSHFFREKLLDKFDLFLELTLGINQKLEKDSKISLPPPKKFALLLQELTAKCINCWHSDFSVGYEKLRYAYKYLREHRLVDFSQFRVQTHEEIIRRQKLAENQERVLTRTIENRLKELKQLKPDIEALLAQIESLLDLLIPDPDKLLHNEDGQRIDDDVPNVGDESLQQIHGIANLSQSIEIEFSPFYELAKNQDNKQIVQNLKELKKELIGTKLTKLIGIEKTLIKRGEQFVHDLKDIIDLKSRCTNLILKLGELKIVNEIDHSDKKRVSTLDDSDSDSDDNSGFEDVEPKEGLETYIPKSMRLEYGLEAINPKELDHSNSFSLADESFTPQSSSSGGSPMIIKCNVKLENGRLCPRKDKIKCPFHGKIIARDPNGIPLDDEERLKEEERVNSRPIVPDWQEPGLLADLKRATGIDLTMPKKGRKLVKQAKLENPKTCDLTPKQRLQKRLKLLNR